jgi:hypothetical protein
MIQAAFPIIAFNFDVHAQFLPQRDERSHIAPISKLLTEGRKSGTRSLGVAFNARRFHFHKSFVGGIEVLGLLRNHLRRDGSLWSTIDAVSGNLGTLRCAIVALFIGGWVVSVAIHRARVWRELMC